MRFNANGIMDTAMNMSTVQVTLGGMIWRSSGNQNLDMTS